MNTTIFKNEKNAKVYEVRAAKSFHIFSKGELIRKVKTDNIYLCTDNYLKDEITIREIAE